jgi:hypothetical protein
VLSGEATHTGTNLIVFGFTRSGLEHTIYHIQGEHANHYTTKWKIIRLIYHTWSTNCSTYCLLLSRSSTNKKKLKTPIELLEAVIRRTDNAMVKRKTKHKRTYKELQHTTYQKSSSASFTNWYISTSLMLKIKILTKIYYQD